jgi:hypothetical protein
VAWVAFDVIGSTGEISLLQWLEYEINEGGLLVTPEDGLIQVDGAQTSLSLPEFSATESSNVIVPLTASPADGTSIALTVEYDWTVIEFVNVTTTLISQDHTLGYDASVPGTLAITLNGASPLTGDGPIVDIEFLVVGSGGDFSPLILTNAAVDGGSITSCVDDGTLYICQVLANEVTGLSIDGSTTLTWDEQLDGITYDVVSGQLSDLVPSGGVGAVTCLVNDAASASHTDTQPDPTTGEGYYYLIRAENACGTGTYGYTEPSHVERLPTGGCATRAP